MGIRVEVSHKMAISGNTVSADNGGWGIYLSNAPEADVTVTGSRTTISALSRSSGAGGQARRRRTGHNWTSDTHIHDNTMI